MLAAEFFLSRQDVTDITIEKLAKFVQRSDINPRYLVLVHQRQERSRESCFTMQLRDIDPSLRHQHMQLAVNHQLPQIKSYLKGQNALYKSKMHCRIAL